jgi:replicative DNA helicase
MDAKSIIFSPTDRMNLTQKHLKRRRDNKGDGIPLYLKGVDYEKGVPDAHFIPAMRGDATAIIARPSNAKTGVMVRWMRERAKWIAKNKIENRVCVYVTTETAVENLSTFLIVAQAREQHRIEKTTTEFAMGDITDSEWAEFEQINADSILLPIWMIGHSLDREAARPDMTPEVIVAAFEEIQKWNDDKTQIDICFFDYLQRFPLIKGMDARGSYSKYVDTFKNIAIQFNTHSVIGVQARREVEDKKWPIPTMRDGAETANIEQSCQNVFSLVRPRMYFAVGDTFGDRNPITIEKDHLLLSCLKQTNGEPNWFKWLKFAPEYNKLDALEEKMVSFNQPRKDLE